MKEKVAAQLKKELQDNPGAPDSKQRERLANAALEQALQEDEGYLKVRREHDRAIRLGDCHYFGSARVYCLVGHGLAEAMKGLLEKK